MPEGLLLNGRIGLGTLLLMWSSTYSLSGCVGGKHNFLEIGAGRTNYIVFFNSPSSFNYALIGYRYQKKLLFKFQILGLINHKNNQIDNASNKQKEITISIGLSFGKAF